MKINNITKKYGDKVIFDNLSYTFKENKITVILGDSGIGKTTLLNVLSNLTSFEGSVTKKEMSYLFQEDRLLPNLTVAENLRLTNPNINVNESLKDFGMEGTENLYLSELSAGMARRIAIIRALNFESEALIMDEPFRNLDYNIKYKIMDIIKKKQITNPKTIVLVTHDISESIYLGDEIIILDNPRKINHVFSEIGKTTEKEILNVFLKNKIS